MTQSVTIDFVSDVVCPWCALGATALEQAIENLAGEVPVELTFKPFELNPDMPAEGENAVKHMMRKYGRSAEEVASGKEMLMARGQAIGFQFDLEKRSHFYNTFDAHRLLFWALQEGRQIELKKGLLRAYFTRRWCVWPLKRGWIRRVRVRCWRPVSSPTRCVSLK
jgi:predicted DsbA family dithiol-disulfide isomerase